IADQAWNIQELGDRGKFFGLFVDPHGRADAAVRVASATDLAAVGAGTMNKIRKVRESAHQGKREPVARRLGDADLRFDVIGEMRKRITLAQPAFGRYIFVAAGKR